MSDRPVCERGARGSDGSVYLLFWCPGCETHHAPTVEGPRVWQFNGDLVRPCAPKRAIERRRREQRRLVRADQRLEVALTRFVGTLGEFVSTLSDLLPQGGGVIFGGHPAKPTSGLVRV